MKKSTDSNFKIMYNKIKNTNMKKIKKIIIALVCSAGLFAATTSTKAIYIPSGCHGVSIYTSCGPIKHTMICEPYDRATLLSLAWFWNVSYCGFD
jgi:hypothetical protein